MTERILDDAKEQLAAMESGRATLQAKFHECVAKKEELDKKYQLCEARLIQTEKVRRRHKIKQNNTALISRGK